jgi:hypothetical protein
MHVLQSSRGVEQLNAVSGNAGTRCGVGLTNLSLEALGKWMRYSLKFPCCIHGDTAASGNVFVSTPKSGKMFGWDNLPQRRISW